MKEVTKVSMLHVDEGFEEGGWGWMVAMAMAVMFVVTVAPMSSFGLIYGEFFDSLGVGTNGVTVVNSIYFASFSFTGLVTNYSLKSYSERQVGLLGATLWFVGNTLTIFATSVAYMSISFGLIPGIGMGFMVPAVFSSFNKYFRRRRAFAMSIAQVVMGAGMALTPIGVRYLIGAYGFRGAHAVLTAVGLHAVLAMAVLRPVQATTRDKTETMDAILGDCRDNNNCIQEKSLVVILSKDGTPGENSCCDCVARKNDLPGDCSCNNCIAASKEINTLAEPPGENVMNTGTVALLEDSKRRLSTSEICGIDLTMKTATAPKHRKVSAVGQAIVDFLDLTLLQDPIYVSIVLGISFAFYADVTFFMIHPLLLLDLGFSKSDTAVCMAIGAAGDLTGRFFLAGLGLRWPTITSRRLFFLGAIFSIISRLAFIACGTFLAVGIMIGITGFFRSWILVTVPLVFVEFSAARFPSAYGLYMVVNGVVAILIGPLVGYIRDTTSSYPMAVHSINLAAMICVVLWSVEFVVQRCKEKQKRVQAEQL